MTLVLPRFWHGSVMAYWLLVEPMMLSRLMQIEQATWMWKETIARPNEEGS